MCFVCFLGLFITFSIYLFSGELPTVYMYGLPMEERMYGMLLLITLLPVEVVRLRCTVLLPFLWTSYYRPTRPTGSQIRSLSHSHLQSTNYTN